MKHKFRQIFAVVTADLHVFLYGLHNSWTNVNSHRLQSPSTKFPSGPLTSDQVSHLMPLLGVGAFIGNLTYSLVVSKFGIKRPLMFLALPHFIGWLLVIFANNVYWLYVSRLMIAFSVGAGYSSVPLFVSDISSDRNRGILCSINHLTNCIANLVGLCASLYLDYHQFAKCAIFVPLIFFVLMSFVPDSPSSLRRLERFEETEKSLYYYKGIRSSLETEKLTQQVNAFKSISFNDFRTPHAKRSVIIVLSLMFFMQFSGFVIVTSNSAAIFAEAGSTLSPLQSSIFVYVIECCAVVTGAFLIDRIGRIPLLITSQTCVTILLFVLSLHHLFKNQIPECNWIPFYGVIFSVYAYMLGIMLVPSTMMIDTYPREILSILVVVSQSVVWLGNSGVNMTYFNLLPIIKLHGCFLLFADICLMNMLFTLFFVPETKGKSYEQIKQMLSE